tara:strand:- start:13053 stop:13526 length:474 start_codon:yes stop_codon:yes gene_type:complete
MNNKKATKDIWTKSPITGKNQVLTEYNDKDMETKMDLSSGFFTNEYPLNYKSNPDFDLDAFESKMPKLMKDLRFDDGESYWYPSSIQTTEGIVFPTGDKNNYKWCYAPIVKLTRSEEKQYSQDVNYESKIDMDNANYYDSYLSAIKNIKGYSLGELS